MRQYPREDTNEEQHHEQTAHAQKTFLDRVDKLFSTIKEMGNPFLEESKDLLTIDSKIVAHPTAAELISTHFEKGKNQLEEFLQSLVAEDHSKFYNPIKKNRIDFFDKKLNTQLTT